MKFGHLVKRVVGPLFLLLLLTATLHAEEWNLGVKAGLSYDYISNDYYLRTIDTLGLTPDSLLELRTISDRIDEQGGWLRLELKHDGPLEFNVAGRLYMTNEKFRSAIDLSANWASLKFLNSTELKSYNNTDDFSLYQRQVRSSSRLGVALMDNEQRYLELSQEVEYTGYSEADPSVTGYYQSESRLRFRQQLGPFSEVDATLRLDLRNNYDSTELDFNRWVGDFGVTHIGSEGYYSSTLYLERRSYRLPDSDDNYTYLSPELSMDRTLVGPINIVPDFKLHYYHYDQENYATFSNLRFEGQLELKYQYQFLSAFSFGLGTEQFAASDTLYADQDYSSWQLLAGYESFTRKWLTLTFDTQFGHRDYHAAEDEFYTDYNFLRLDLLADIAIFESLRLSVIGGGDLEYHSDKENNVFLHMLSTTLTYKFQ